MRIYEIEEKAKPLYVGLRFDDETCKQIMDFIEENEIENPISENDIHCTLIYSTKPVSGYKTPDECEHIATFKEFTKFGDCLVMILDAPSIEDRHEELMDDLNASFDYPTYKPHITLSYDCPKFDMNTETDFDDFVAIKEYSDDIDTEFAEKTLDNEEEDN